MVQLSLMLHFSKEFWLKIDGWVLTHNNAVLKPEHMNGLRQMSHLALNLPEVRIFDPASLAVLQRWSAAPGEEGEEAAAEQLILPLNGLECAWYPGK